MSVEIIHYCRHEENYSSTRRCALQEYLRNLVRIPQLRRNSNVLKYFLNFNFIEECVDAEYDDYYNEEERRRQYSDSKETFNNHGNTHNNNMLGFSRPSDDRESDSSWGDRSPRAEEGEDDDYNPSPTSEEVRNGTSSSNSSAQRTNHSDDSTGDFEVRVSTEGDIFLKGNHSQENLADLDYDGELMQEDDEGSYSPSNRLERSASLNSEDSQFEYDSNSGGIRVTNEFNSQDSDDEEGYVDDNDDQGAAAASESTSENQQDVMEVDVSPPMVAKSPSRMLPEELHNYKLTI